ncbi:MAG: PBP1A family penicillin-binding protein [Xanthomonadaceae bacterium]|nr:PBP1A family penicillin-binding protein [Xanthomonadaceae bacterium]
MKRTGRIITTCIALTALFSSYLWYLYSDLEKSFGTAIESTPTKIYSDVIKVSKPLTRKIIEEQLKLRAYSSTSPEPNILQFELHPIRYPETLIPEHHPQLFYNGIIQLEFESQHSGAALSKIRGGDQEFPELYLEPEIVATLAHSGFVKHIRDVVKFDDVPTNIWQAIIAIEDQHFLDHKGLDPRGLLRAMWVNLKTFSFAQGGSTITQQLVKNLMARRTKNIIKKFNELFLSLLLEIKYDKEKILERYLNEVYLGQVGNLEVHGVSEGARLFFGKSLSQLNLAECALMAGLIRGPAVYSPYRHQDRAVARQKVVLQKMVETGQIAPEEMEEALLTKMRFTAPLTESNKAPYFVDYVKAQLLEQLKGRLTEEEITSAGFNIYTTLDVRFNKAAQAAVFRGVTEAEKNLQIPANERLEGALASIDHRTGFIRALVGGRKYEDSTFNRILNMKRQVGSTFKPIVALTAISEGKDKNGLPYGPAYPVVDEAWSLNYDHGMQSWAPKNYEKEFFGHILLREALNKSINTVIAKLGWEIGIEKVIETAKKLGIDAKLDPIPALSLGVAEMSPVELLKTYSAIANRGTQEELTVIRAITYADDSSFAHFVPNSKNVYDPTHLDLLIDMMTTTFEIGTAKSAKLLGWDRLSAGKTGTTSNHRDSWFAGFTPQLTTVVWVGIDSDKSDQSPKLTGATAALPVWVEYMKRAHEGVAVESFYKNDAIIDVKIDKKTGKQAAWGCPDTSTSTEKFIRGYEPKESACSTP